MIIGDGKIDCMVINAVFKVIKIMLWQWVHLSMLFCASFYVI